MLVCELGEAGCREAHATPPSGRVRPGACQQAVSPSGTGPGLAGLDTGMQALLWQANGEQQQRTACQESAQARCGAAALHTQAEVKQQSCPTVWRGAAKPRGVGAAGFFEVKKISPPAESLGIHELPSNTHNGDQISVRGEVRRLYPAAFPCVCEGTRAHRLAGLCCAAYCACAQR